VRRLCDDPGAPGELRELLLLNARDTGPSEQELARLAARMAPLVGFGLGELQGAAPAQGVAPAELAGSQPLGAALGKATLAKLGGSWSAKLLVAGAAALAGAGLWWGIGRPATPPPAPIEAAAPVSGPALAPPHAEPLPAASPVPGATAAEVDAREPSPAAPNARAARRAAPRVPPPDELSLINQAQALRARPAEALRVLAEHAKWYPQGMLSQEREVLAIEALVQAGKLDQARARAARLEASHPSSVHLPRVRSLLDRAAHE
jgi:hypothetical protein